MIFLLRLLAISLFRPRKGLRDLAIENLALRQRLAVYHQKKKKPKIFVSAKLFWVVLSKMSGRWKDALVIVKPGTVIKWHRQGFKTFWRWKSRRRKPGRPRIHPETRAMIRQMAVENPGWGAPQIHGQLLKLGYDISQSTVENYMPSRRKPPSQTWRTFLKNHAREIVACDFFIMPTVAFRVLFVFILLDHDRRRILPFNVTSSPSAAWTAQQVVNAFPEDTAPRFLLRDRDGVYGGGFLTRVENMGIEQVVTAPKSPWQNPYVERVIGSIRRECLDYCIVLGERHLHCLVAEYARHYNRTRTHLSLDKDCPVHRDVEQQSTGAVKSEPVLGGLHHRYYREAA